MPINRSSPSARAGRCDCAGFAANKASPDLPRGRVVSVIAIITMTIAPIANRRRSIAGMVTIRRMVSFKCRAHARAGSVRRTITSPIGYCSLKPIAESTRTAACRSLFGHVFAEMRGSVSRCIDRPNTGGACVWPHPVAARFCRETTWLEAMHDAQTSFPARRPSQPMPCRLSQPNAIKTASWRSTADDLFLLLPFRPRCRRSVRSPRPPMAAGPA